MVLNSAINRTKLAFAKLARLIIGYFKQQLKNIASKRPWFENRVFQKISTTYLSEPKDQSY
jgi:hypothetical protein